MATLHLSRWMFVAAALVGALRPVGVDGVSAIDSGTLPLPTRLHKTVSKECRPSGPGLVGNLLDEAGCHLNRKSGAHHSALLNDTLEPLREWSRRVLQSTRRVNAGGPSIARTADAQGRDSECAAGCQKTPPCCEVDIKLTFPLYGRSLSSNSVVEIVQGLGDIRQPIIYHECRTTEANLVRGRCVQTSLPRLMYIRDNRGPRRGYNYREDLVLVPTSCDCIVSLSPAAAKTALNNTDPNSVPLFDHLPFATSANRATTVTPSPATAATVATSAPATTVATFATAATTATTTPTTTTTVAADAASSAETNEMPKNVEEESSTPAATNDMSITIQEGKSSLSLTTKIEAAATTSDNSPASETTASVKKPAGVVQIHVSNKNVTSILRPKKENRPTTTTAAPSTSTTPSSHLVTTTSRKRRVVMNGMEGFDQNS